MLVVGLKPGHDGAVCAIRDGNLLFSYEAEHDSYPRHSEISALTLVHALTQLPDRPDVIALGGWHKEFFRGNQTVGAGYHGVEDGNVEPMRIMGEHGLFFSSSHERSHIRMVLAMAPSDRGRFSGTRAVLVWEGLIGAFYIVDATGSIVEKIDVLQQPGARFSTAMAIADPTFPVTSHKTRDSDSGKLMALAAFETPPELHATANAIADRIIDEPSVHPLTKGSFRDTLLYNAGADSEILRAVARSLSTRIFDRFAKVARARVPEGIPLLIAGGCGLNCDWNTWWRHEEHFSETFVAPCANDSGSAIGTAADAMWQLEGRQSLAWSVYSGEEFVLDLLPDSRSWSRHEADMSQIAGVLAEDEVVAWVQGRAEVGPRALGHRSLLAAPFNRSMLDRLNAIKGREWYRPVAPCCPDERLGDYFEDDFLDPYMLHFRQVSDSRLAAVTHVDGSARVQSVSSSVLPELHSLLSEFGELTGAHVLCNTSLNFQKTGFINRMSDLVAFCDARQIENFVVAGSWYRARRR